ncbi:MAG: hypothetical protein A3F84_10415 [Candidatus Handelsmanbacteria bacterium RIFCSPLOWO2_12_FULL_64_10]|uniref:Uncharacterized protein n=1 Tax=Handelsmanbacteria sp. (strain RIFCSPLOWO2_12_FULL_64_10) TaxID=1817868 RepID=A0A1F6CB61_HANXR|nr:MAG: hypothetical protein A3F84_10415 [Candidatus Handelsmanbacteria bacterium RIFCSPLOWO2_12_FULL_64_10]
MPRRLPPSDIERNGDGEMVNDCLARGWTYRKTIDFVREATGVNGEPGRAYSEQQIHRHYHKRFLASIEKVQEVERLVDAFMQRQGEGADVDIAAILRQVLLTQSLEAVTEMDAARIKAMKPGELALMIARLERTGAATAQLRMKYGKGVDAALEAILAGLERDLQGDPELFARLKEKAEAAAARIKEGAA